MKVLATARKAVFGETWLLPIAVGAELAAAAAFRHCFPGAWAAAGGPAMVVATALILVVLVESGRSR